MERIITWPGSVSLQLLERLLQGRPLSHSAAWCGELSRLAAAPPSLPGTGPLPDVPLFNGAALGMRCVRRMGAEGAMANERSLEGGVPVRASSWLSDVSCRDVERTADVREVMECEGNVCATVLARCMSFR